MPLKFKKPLVLGKKYEFNSDLFTLVGSPSVTSDGIASGFNMNNNIIVEDISPYENELHFEAKYVWNGNIPAKSVYLLSFHDQTKDNFFAVYQTSKNGALNAYSKYNGRDSSYFGDVTIQLNIPVYITMIATPTSKRLVLKQNNNILADKTLSANMSQSITNLTLGFLYGTATVQGAIDLNSLKIYVDGNLVYQPCLKIPYTQSKTGSKIVDVAYRSRVQDMYEQVGYAPYYTIDKENENFTLPMGELYGFIGNCVTRYGTEIIEGFQIFTHGQNDYTSDSASAVEFRQPNAQTFGQNTYHNIQFSDAAARGVAMIGSVQTISNNGGVRLLGWNNSTNAWQDVFVSTVEKPARYVVEAYQNGTSGYRLWSDNWCEQWNSSMSDLTLDTTITFFKPYRDTNYFLSGVGFLINNQGRQVVQKTTTGFTTSSVVNSCSTNWWKAEGYIA